MGRKKISISTEDYVNDIIDTTGSRVKEYREREKRIISADELIPTGSTLFNLSLSDNYEGGYSIGKFSNLIGDTHAGKSLIALTMLAQCSYLKRFDNFTLIYDDVEASNEFDVSYLFGSKVEKRIRFDIISNSAEDFYGNIYRKIKEGRPFVYILDTFDAIASEEDKERAESLADGKKAGGTYGTSKPKLASEMFRTIKGDIRRAEGFLLVISQTRDNIGFGSQFKPKTRSGGKALGFYSTHESWLSVVRQVKEKDMAIGAVTECKITKNKLTGKKRTIQFPIYNDYGIDDISANVDYLIEEGYWEKRISKKDISEVKRGRKKKESGGVIVAPEFGFEGVRRKLIYDIEEAKLDGELAVIVAEIWKKKEDSIRLNRRPRFYEE
uniref:Putative RecA n=1 Tax=viral metagenome TaxID=1070528 RepID=A0A6M3JUQ7_9ZZZZ